MAIQMRRGNAEDFIPSKMLPGEWAVSQDNQKLYICFSPGHVVEIGTVSSLREYIEAAEAWAVGQRGGEDVDIDDQTYHNNSKYYSQQASTSATNANESEANASSYADTAQTYADNASDSADDAQGFSESAEAALEEIQNAMARIMPTMDIDFTTGHLISTGTYFDFLIDNNGHLNWGIAG